MNRLQLIAVLAVIVTLLTSSNRTQAQEKFSLRKATPLEQLLSQSDNTFGFNLFREINKTEQGKNLLISPFSVAMALAMTYNGAAGSTKVAMENTLELAGFKLDEINKTNRSLLNFLQQLDPEVTMEIANSIWYRQSLPVKRDFVDLNADYYDAEVRRCDFADPKTPALINDWVDLKTHGKIPRIIESIDPLDQMFLIDAIYFKGSWTHPFKEKNTKTEPFHSASGREIPCQMMIQDHHLAYYANEKLQAINLPFGLLRYGMTIVLPAAEMDLDTLIDGLDQELWADLVEGLSSSHGRIFLPQIEFEYKVELKDQLSALGMAVCFGKKADFGKISDFQLFIDEVLHKSYIKTDEKGAEAAAVTSVRLKGLALMDQQPQFTMRVDRPFLFAIHEQSSGAILFLGKVVDPTLK